ncbi:ETX/MTX2 family pore-forming toxin [Streptomyces sp. NPDC019396]|uniref:ETX/MTX2 family pore-forming toxin n=1 Tax=Streptomyces sp. NPDC019396 TaxID=3154687 RepID=UPI00340934EA
METARRKRARLSTSVTLASLLAISASLLPGTAHAEGGFEYKYPTADRITDLDLLIKDAYGKCAGSFGSDAVHVDSSKMGVQYESAKVRSVSHSSASDKSSTFIDSELSNPTSRELNITSGEVQHTFTDTKTTRTQRGFKIGNVINSAKLGFISGIGASPEFNLATGEDNTKTETRTYVAPRQTIPVPPNTMAKVTTLMTPTKAVADMDIKAKLTGSIYVSSPHDRPGTNWPAFGWLYEMSHMLDWDWDCSDRGYNFTLSHPQTLEESGQGWGWFDGGSAYFDGAVKVEAEGAKFVTTVEYYTLDGKTKKNIPPVALDGDTR